MYLNDLVNYDTSMAQFSSSFTVLDVHFIYFLVHNLSSRKTTIFKFRMMPINSLVYIVQGPDDGNGHMDCCLTDNEEKGQFVCLCLTGRGACKYFFFGE